MEYREVVSERGHDFKAKQTDPSRNKGTVSNAIKEFETAANDKQFKENQPEVNDVKHGRVQGPERTNGVSEKYNTGNERDSASGRLYLGKQESRFSGFILGACKPTSLRAPRCHFNHNNKL